MYIGVRKGEVEDSYWEGNQLSYLRELTPLGGGGIRRRSQHIKVTH